MRSYQFKLVDVFTDNPLEGNLLPVVFDADSLSDDELQAIAREFNSSETTFVLKPENETAPWRLRSFTPKAEVFGAGHNALGACWALAENNLGDLKEGKNVVYQEIGTVLPLEIYVEAGKIEKILMTQDKPVFGEKFSDFKALAETLNLDESDFETGSILPQAVSTGAFHFLVPVKNLEALKKVQADPRKLAALAKPLGCEGCYLYSLETVEAGSAAHTRAFFPGIGISEDPATGTAAGPLAVLLAANGILPEGESLIIEQGFEIDRPSRIEVIVSGETVKVGGRCLTVGEGKINL
jgi:trans-2,3-dihydro-3-hydroxyanthranilate isomerase